MLRHIRQSEFVEGRWRNGQGVSWEIASFKKEDAADFSWRFAKARIDNDVPFSIYPGMDRIFMMIEGGRVLQVHEKFVPHEFSCDVPLFCKLLGGPSLDLNLFAARDEFRAECEVINLAGSIDLNVARTDVVLFALDGACELNGVHLQQGDAAILQNESVVVCKAKSAQLYVGKLHQL
jgi:uncharacterized protein